MIKPEQNHAVVIGGSMAGMLAARVLSARFGRVTVLERDSYPARPEPRAGVPQAHHVHVLLGRGRQILERLFSGILDDLFALGATMFDSAADFAWLTPKGWGPRFYSGQPAVACSRALMDWVVLSRLGELPNVRIREQVDARRLVVREGRVAGVTVQERHGDRVMETISADLVVDASGRNSQLPLWLAESGFARPEETVVDGGMGYASCVFGRSWAASQEFRATYSQAAPPRVCRSGLAFPIEGERWLVSLSGGGGDHPPVDMEGFREFARSLPNPFIHEIVESCTPLTGVRGYRQIPNRMRHYERTPMPQGLAVLGDSVCSFNPVYGQGITVAAIGAELLGECIDRGMVPVFQKKLAAELRDPWALATSEDCRYPGVALSKLELGVRLRQRFMDMAVRASIGDPWVRARLIEVIHMVRKPSFLLRPRVLLRMLRGNKETVVHPWLVRRGQPVESAGATLAR